MAELIQTFKSQRSDITPNSVGLIKKGLKIFHLNTCHLMNKLDEVKNVILKGEYELDICCFTDTFLTSLTDNAILEVDGYHLFRKDRGTQGRGILVYVSNEYNVVRRQDIEMSNLETIWLEVTFTQSKSLLICYVYRPPSSPISWFEDMTGEINFASTLRSSDSVLIGDFNIDLMCAKKNNSEKSKWNDIMKLYGYKQVINEYTRVTDTSKTLIDHIYVKNMN